MDGFFPTIFDPVLFSIQDFDAFYKERMTLVCPTKDILRLRIRIVWIRKFTLTLSTLFPLLQMYSILHSVLIFLTRSFSLTFDVKNWFRQMRISGRWGSFDTRKFANSRLQRSFRFSNVPHPKLLIFLTRSSPLLVPAQMDFAGGWGPWGLFKSCLKVFPASCGGEWVYSS